MSERKPSSFDRSGEQAAPRPIPDGGLGKAMPEWLRRPPAWRNLEPKAPPRRPLPPPDTSVIDPATLISVDDLPAWLQTIAQPPKIQRDEPATPPETPERRVIPREIEARPRPALSPAPPPTKQPEPTLPTSPEQSAPVGLPPEANAMSSRRSPSPPGPSNAAIVLGTLLAVALVTIAVLLWLLLM